MEVKDGENTVGREIGGVELNRNETKRDEEMYKWEVDELQPAYMCILYICQFDLRVNATL